MNKVVFEGGLGFWFKSDEKLALYDGKGTIYNLNNIILSEANKYGWIAEDKQVRITIEEI